MFLKDHALKSPEKIAYVMAGSGRGVTYYDLNIRTIQGANLFRKLELTEGDRVVVYMENNISFIEVALACIRAGLYVVPVGRHLKEQELLYILEDSDAKVLVTSIGCMKTLRFHTLPSNIRYTYVVEGQMSPFAQWETAIDSQSQHDEGERPILGAPMYYSSGTTGRPKGICIPLTESRSEYWKRPLKYEWPEEMGIACDENNRNLVTGPLYHIAPLSFACLALALGGTAVIMERFDAEWALLLIEQYGISHVHMVPTMFSRMLMLEPAVRSKYNLSTLKHVEHNSAPCPISVKEGLIEWLGPIIYEVYGASEPAGCTFINSTDWLRHKGSVGRAAYGQLHVLDQNHHELPPYDIGEVFFSGSEIDFTYLNAPDKKSARSTSEGWFSYGDIGYVDQEGYLYLVDRKDNMIIVGGQNVYPLEVENHLSAHPYVYDVAVLGIPDPIYGQLVKAYVQLRDQKMRDTATETELVTWCRSRIAHYKCPTAIEFVDALPRTEHGKLLKRYLTKASAPVGANTSIA